MIDIFYLGKDWDDPKKVNFEIYKFPDGQQNIRITDEYLLNYDDKFKIFIKANIYSFLDLELVICANKIFKMNGFKDVQLDVGYMIGGRSDRDFEDGTANYFKDVVAPILNQQDFSLITVLDPHSQTIANCLNNVKVITNYQFVNSYLEKNPKTLIISPDFGAYNKLSKMFKNAYVDILYCYKDIDLINGNITKTVVPITQEIINQYESITIVDDICDGGRTFINIAEEIKNSGLEGADKIKLNLLITHAIFSKGIGILEKYFNEIKYITIKI